MVLSQLIATLPFISHKTPIDELVPAVCPNGELPKISLEWIHMQDTTDALSAWKDHAGDALAKVSYKLNEWFNNNLEDDVKFSFYEFADKPSACMNMATTFADCYCSHHLFDSLNYSDLGCGPAFNHACDRWEHEMQDLKYANNQARPSLFDPILDITSSLGSLPIWTDRKAVRIITVMTDNCARESARGENVADQAGLWKNLTEDQIFEYSAGGYQLFNVDGDLIQKDCDKRDYPTLHEVAATLKETGTALVVAYSGGLHTACQDTTESETLNMNVHDYWSQRVSHVMNVEEVPFIAEPTVDSESLYEKLIRGIIDITGNGCN